MIVVLAVALIAATAVVWAIGDRSARELADEAEADAFIRDIRAVKPRPRHVFLVPSSVTAARAPSADALRAAVDLTGMVGAGSTASPFGAES